MLLCGALSAATLPAADTLTGEFQRALFEEEANRNLPAAIAGYEAVIKRLDEQRQLAATAVFRLGESYRKLGKTNKALAAYERIIKEFADQETLVKLSGQNLSILRPAISASPTVDGNSELPLRRWIDLWSPRWEAFLEIAKGFEPMSDVELHLLATAVPEAGIVEAKAKVQRAESAAERFKIHPEDFVIDAKNPNPVEALQLSKDELSNKRASALRALEALAASERRLAGRGDAVTGAGGGSQTGGQDASMLAIRVEYERLKETLDQLGQPMSREQLRALAQVLLPDSTFARLDEMAVAARAELAGLLSQYGPEYGPVKAAQSRLDEINRSIEERIAAVLQAAQFKLKSLEQVVASESNVPQSTDASITAEEAEELRRVQALAANSPDLINKREKDGLPPLHLAIQRGHLNVVRYLLANGASPSATDGSLRTPLYLAAQRGQLNAVKVLLSAGVSIDQASNNGETPLHGATQFGNDAVISFLLAEGANVNAQDKDGRTSLHFAAAKGLTNALALLIAGSANPEVAVLRQWEKRSYGGNMISYDHNGTPLHFAIANQQVAAAKLLLENGANPNPQTGLASPLWRAVQLGDTNIVHQLIQAGSVTTNEPLIESAIERMPAEIPFLLEAGANPNLVSSGQSSPPLHRAIGLFSDQWRRQTQTLGSSPTGVGVRPAGGQLNAVTTQSMPALPPTALTPHEQEIVLEVNRNAINQTVRGGFVESGSDGDLDWAVIVKSMIEHGADINSTHGTYTPLLLLANFAPQTVPTLEMISWVLEKGADPNLSGGRAASSNVGGRPGRFADGGGFVNSPLIAACKAGNVELAALLIKHGARLEAPEGQDEWPPLRVAVNFRQHDIVRLLLEKGAKPNALDAQGKTALYVLFNKRLLPGPPETETLWSGNRKTFSGTASSRLVSSQTLPDDLATTRLLLERGSRLDLPLADSLYLPIHFAAAIEDDRFLKLFLEFKADPNTTNAVGVTPLHAAAAMNQSENIRLLVQTGADVNRPDQNGDTPLHIAAFLNRVSASEVLLELGADRERKNRFGVNPVQVQSFSQGIRTNKRPPFGLPEYLDPIKNVTDVLGR